MKYFVLLLCFGYFNNANAAWKAITVESGNHSQLISIQEVDAPHLQGKLEHQSLPFFLSEDPLPVTSPTFKETWYSEDSLPLALQAQAATLIEMHSKAIEGAEVRTIVEQGPHKNRINLTILGDGYTEAEKEKFFKDVTRIKDDLFGVSTFSTYLPLFNVYAVFVPSKDSGITDLTTKNTAFGLYRTPKGSKRAIMPGNTLALERAISMVPVRTDYPIVIANDDFYGGLGGRYAITTRSLESGSMVLRHELGHNFGNVGEEYDGGQVYSGANSSRSTDVTWKAWLTGGMKAHESLYLSGAYVWQSLSEAPTKIDFKFPEPSAQGDYQPSVLLSTVGWSSADDVRVYLNGTVQKLKGVYTKDRSFFEIEFSSSLAPGKHSLEIRENIADGDNVLAFANVYANSATYDSSDKTIAAYPTYFAPGKPSGFRPTHETCLMRNMRSPKFCSVDLENMWKRFLYRISFLDSVSVDRGTKKVTLRTANLKGLQATWYKVNTRGEKVIVAGLKDKLEATFDELTGAGKFHVRVEFKTPEVRVHEFVNVADFEI